MTLAILLFGLVVATCFIAYLADNLGKNLGKKRISLLGLRPRQTATLISMVSSVGVMLLTVVILLVTSRSLSNALLRYDIEKKQANELRRKNQTLVRDLSAQRNELEEQRNELATQVAENRRLAENVVDQRREAETQLQSVNSRLAEVRERLTAAQSARAAALKGVEAARRGERTAQARAREASQRYARAERQFQNFKAQLDRVQEQHRAAQAQSRSAQAGLRREQQRVAQARRQFEEARVELDSAQEQLTEAQRQESVARTRLNEATVRLEQAEEHLENVQARVNENLREIQQKTMEVATLEARRDQLQSELETRTHELAELKLLTAQLREESDRIQAVAERIATGQVAMRRAEVFAETTVPSHASAAQARSALRELLAEGRSRFASSDQTMTLVTPRIVVGKDQVVQLTEEEFLSGFGARLSSSEESVSVRLLAARDHARGETEIFVHFLEVPVRRVFPQGELLNTAVVDADSGDAAIFNRLLAILNETEERARDRGVTPLLSAENQFFFAAGTNERIFEALRRIQAVGGKVRVRVLAAEDITTVDSMRVSFDISSA